MKREIMQYRYSLDGVNNYPADISIDKLASGEYFENKNIVQLGIQSVGGVRFYLNGNVDNQGVVIDSTGIYELNVDGITLITNLQFDRNTLTNATSVIIDIVYESEEGMN